MNEQEQRAYDLETTGKYEELNAWIVRNGKAFIVGTDDGNVWRDIMAAHDLCPNGMFWCASIAEADLDARRNAFFGVRSHVFDRAILVTTHEAVKR